MIHKNKNFTIVGGRGVVVVLRIFLGFECSLDHGLFCGSAVVGCCVVVCVAVCCGCLSCCWLCGLVVVLMLLL